MDAGIHKANVGGIPDIQAAVDHHGVVLGCQIGARQNRLTPHGGAEYQHKHNKDLDQTFRSHGQILLLEHNFFRTDHRQGISGFENHTTSLTSITHI
jgi:hypothetical protein